MSYKVKIITPTVHLKIQRETICIYGRTPVVMLSNKENGWCGLVIVAGVNLALWDFDMSGDHVQKNAEMLAINP